MQMIEFQTRSFFINFRAKMNFFQLVHYYTDYEYNFGIMQVY